MLSNVWPNPATYIDMHAHWMTHNQNWRLLRLLDGNRNGLWTGEKTEQLQNSRLMFRLQSVVSRFFRMSFENLGRTGWNRGGGDLLLVSLGQRFPARRPGLLGVVRRFRALLRSLGVGSRRFRALAWSLGNQSRRLRAWVARCGNASRLLRAMGARREVRGRHLRARASSRKHGSRHLRAHSGNVPDLSRRFRAWLARLGKGGRNLRAVTWTLPRPARNLRARQRNQMPEGRRFWPSNPTLPHELG
jgi:hypothetical protein